MWKGAEAYLSFFFLLFLFVCVRVFSCDYCSVLLFYLPFFQCGPLFSWRKKKTPVRIYIYNKTLFIQCASASIAAICSRFQLLNRVYTTKKKNKACVCWSKERTRSRLSARAYTWGFFVIMRKKQLSFFFFFDGRTYHTRSGKKKNSVSKYK